MLDTLAWSRVMELQLELKQLKQEFRKFLEYSKIALSYENEVDYSEPNPSVKTVLKFTPVQE